jgi:hypothetical protein
MKVNYGKLSVEASQEEVSNLKGPLKKLWHRHGLKAAAFFTAAALFIAYLEAPTATKDQAAQNPNCRILINSYDSSYTNNGQVLGPGACMNSLQDRFDGNGSIAGKPDSK